MTESTEPRGVAVPALWQDRYSLYGALLVAWVAMLGSLLFSEVLGFVPCTWCWYQRILMYPLPLLLAVGLLRREGQVLAYVLPFALLGTAASTYHYLLQKTTWFTESAACTAGVPCTVTYINAFGFVTIPFLALIAFVLILFLSIVGLTGSVPLWEEDGTMPWLPFLSILAAGVLIVASAFFLFA